MISFECFLIFSSSTAVILRKNCQRQQFCISKIHKVPWRRSISEENTLYHQICLLFHKRPSHKLSTDINNFALHCSDFEKKLSTSAILPTKYTQGNIKEATFWRNHVISANMLSVPQKNFSYPFYCHKQVCSPSQWFWEKIVYVSYFAYQI